MTSSTCHLFPAGKICYRYLTRIFTGLTVIFLNPKYFLKQDLIKQYIRLLGSRFVQT